jgi:diguanylate cyclase (GGDEF)-like protein
VGGEEFAVLIGKHRTQALALAEALRAAVAAEDFIFEATKIPVTISAGVAEAAAGENAQALYQRADAKLYAAKHGGRNRVAG